MRPVIFLLFGLLAASSTLVQAKAEPEEGVRWALGLDLPRMDGFSLWRVGPDRAWGLALTRADYIHNSVTEPFRYRDKDGNLETNRRGRLPAGPGWSVPITVQRSGPSSGDVTAFTFGTLLGGYNYVHWPNWDQEERTRVYLLRRPEGRDWCGLEALRTRRVVRFPRSRSPVEERTTSPVTRPLPACPGA